MAGIVDLKLLLKEMYPILDETDYVFCTKKTSKITKDIIDLEPIGTFIEKEGITLIIKKEKADANKIAYDGVFNKITLEIHSSLEAVGLTATFSKALTSYNISANVVAGYYHDHIFVPKNKANLAMKALKELSN
jgi:hypothetical protein